MKLRARAKKLLKTVPGKVAAALLTAVAGAGVAYFAPGILDSLTGRDDLQVSAQTDVAQIDTFDDLGRTVIVPYGDPARGSPGKGCSGFQAWADRVGGVEASRTDFRIVVQGGSEEVYIGGIHARLLGRREPVDGTGFQCPSAGAAEVRAIVIDLDERGPAPAGVWVVGESEKNVSFTIAPGETEVFDVTAHTEGCYCKWVLELETTQGGEQKTITIDDHGRDFETTAWRGAPEPWGSYPSHVPPFYAWDWEGSWRSVSSRGETTAEYRADAGSPPLLPTAGQPPT